MRLFNRPARRRRTAQDLGGVGGQGFQMRQSHPLRQLMQGDHSKLGLERKRLLRNASRIVVKVGTSTVTAPDGTLRRDYVEPLVSSIARLHAAGKQVVLVSSGAIGLGRGWVGLHRSRLDDLVTKQACAAVGQGLLMNAYKEMFSAWHIKIDRQRRTLVWSPNRAPLSVKVC